MAKLMWNIRKKDEDGFPEESDQNIEIYVEKKSVKRSEYYESMRAGVKVNLVVEVRQEDYELSAHETDKGIKYADKLEFDGIIYEILRTYETGKAKIELVCS